MGRHGPHELHALFAAAINAKDVDRVVALYESGAAMVIEPGRVLTDARDLRSAVSKFVARASFIKVETIGVLEAQGLALLRSEWTLHEETGSVISSRSIEVSRRQADGTWRYIIDNPWAD